MGFRGILGAGKESSVRKEGIEPSRELPHRNLNGLGGLLTARDHMIRSVSMGPEKPS